MSNLNGRVNKILNQMHEQVVATNKGSYGELAVFAICEEFYQDVGGILIHSYNHKVDPNLAGNIKKDDSGNCYVEKPGSHTEIDVLYVSPYRVFPIEVKAYKALKNEDIVLTNDGIKGCSKTEKSPVHQNEMHCRHLYSFLFRGLPDGGTKRPVNSTFGVVGTDYIVPIVCLVDRATVIDNRDNFQREYMKLCILNNLKETIKRYNTPLDAKLNLTLIDKLLKENKTFTEKYLPPRM